MRWQFVRGLQKLLSKCYKIVVEPMTPTGAAAWGSRKMTPIRIQPGQKLTEEEWQRHSREIAAGLQELLAGQEGATIRSLLDEQVELITSLPLDAARRVQELSLQAVSGAKPRDDIMAEIMRSGQVSLDRANLIARTEVGRANAVLTQSRAERVGSPGYIWNTSHDDAVRPEHRRLDGKFFEWDKPPVAMKNGTRAHPGETPNCRCWADPVMPSEVEKGGRVRLRAS